jgi:hypothetical protein
VKRVWCVMRDNECLHSVMSSEKKAKERVEYLRYVEPRVYWYWKRRAVL